MNARSLSAVEGEGAECSICFAPLPTEQVCVLMRHVYGKKRSCRHYFHSGCIQLMKRQTPAPHVCPNCREPFETLEALPDVRLNSRAWFKLVDSDEGGALEKSEVVDALSATLPVDPELLWQSLNGELWEQWDTNHTGRISLDDFERPGKGLLHFVLYSMPSLRREGGSSTSAPVPDLVESREGWFRYWDENSKQMLEFLQFLRALARTLRLEGAKEDAGVLRAVLSTVWQEFGLTESNQEIHKPVSLALFCEKPDGFCDALLDALQKKFGPAKFRRIRQRAHLMQQPAAVLKKELRSLNCNRPDLLEKDELVAAILDAQELGPQSPQEQAPAGDRAARLPSPAGLRSSPASPTSTQGASRDRQCPEGLKVLNLKGLQLRLRAYGVPYGHCLEREELEDLLVAQGDTGVETLPESPPQRPVQTSTQARTSPMGSQPGTTTLPNSPSARTGHSLPSATAPRPQTMGAATPSVGSEPRRMVSANQPVPTVTEPPDTDDVDRLTRCMKGCVLQ